MMTDFDANNHIIFPNERSDIIKIEGQKIDIIPFFSSEKLLHKYSMIISLR